MGKEKEPKLIEVRLVSAHTHNGTEYAAGEPFAVSEIDYAWLKQNNLLADAGTNTEV